MGSNLDVKRVKYSYKQNSPGDGQYSPEEDKKEPGRGQAQQSVSAASPFQPSGKEGGRTNNKGVRRAGPQAERAR